MSDYLINQYKMLHRNRDDYGTTSISLLEQARLVIDELNPESVLDFGCGKGKLLRELERLYPEIKFYGYDPAMPGREKIPVDRGGDRPCNKH